MNHFTVIMNPKKSWEAFEPSEKTPWTKKMAAHLYRRAGFGGNYAELKNAETQSPADVVDSMFATESSSFLEEIKTLERQIRSGGNVGSLPNFWLYRMAKSKSQLLEKTTLFWHGHFATSAEKVDDVGMMLDQNNLLRENALQKFMPLVLAISKDPAMLTYLDSKENRKTRPNENYSRELMELFCLGLGNYSEDDIKQIARAFTGWEIKNDKFRFNKYQHDYGTKEFLGSSGEFNGEDAVAIVLKQKSSSEFIAKKLINYFVTDSPVATSIVRPIANLLSKTNFDVGVTIKTILKSNFFYESIGKKIRSPIELGVGLLRTIEATGNFVQLSTKLGELGQRPFFPPNVKGWTGGRSWINSATLLSRVNMVGELLNDEKTKYSHGGLEGLVKHYRQQSPEQMLQFFEELLLARNLTQSAKKKLLLLLTNKKESSENRIRQTVYAIAALPEFQLA